MQRLKTTGFAIVLFVLTALVASAQPPDYCNASNGQGECFFWIQKYLPGTAQADPVQDTDCIQKDILGNPLPGQLVERQCAPGNIDYDFVIVPEGQPRLGGRAAAKVCGPDWGLPCYPGVKTPTPTSTSTGTSTRTATPSDTPTRTATPSDTPTRTATPSDTPTRTATPSDTPTRTATSTATNQPTPTRTPTPTLTATRPATSTSTATRVPNTATPTPTSVVRRTPRPDDYWLFGYVYPPILDAEVSTEVLYDPEFHVLAVGVSKKASSDRVEDLPQTVTSGTAHLFIVPTSVPVKARVTPGIGEEIEEVTQHLHTGNYLFWLPGYGKLDPSSVCVEVRRDDLSPARVCGSERARYLGKKDETSPEYKAPNLHWLDYPAQPITGRIEFDLSTLAHMGYKVVRTNGYRQLGEHLWALDNVTLAEDTEVRNFIQVDMTQHGSFEYTVSFNWKDHKGVEQSRQAVGQGTN